MSQESTTSKAAEDAENLIASVMIFFGWWLFIVASLLLTAIALTVASVLVATFIATILRMWVLVSTLASLAVEKHPAILAAVPFGAPWWRNLWAAFV
jgi:hypothetical protein